jgi:hypothetical protein
MESFLKRDLTGDSREPTVWPHISGGSIAPCEEAEALPDPMGSEFANQCQAVAAGYEFTDDCGIPRRPGLIDDTQFDPFLACPPQVDEFPAEDPIAVERRHALSALKHLLVDREYATIPLWIALEHPDLVRRVFGHFKRGVGLAATVQVWDGEVFTEGGVRYKMISYRTKTGKRVRYARKV